MATRGTATSAGAACGVGVRSGISAMSCPPWSTGPALASGGRLARSSLREDSGALAKAPDWYALNTKRATMTTGTAVGQGVAVGVTVGACVGSCVGVTRLGVGTGFSARRTRSCMLVRNSERSAG